VRAREGVLPACLPLYAAAPAPVGGSNVWAAAPGLHMRLAGPPVIPHLPAPAPVALSFLPCPVPAAYLGSLLATLYVSLVMHSYLFSLIFCGAQVSSASLPTQLSEHRCQRAAGPASHDSSRGQSGA
jgi:hypothetical protein